MNNKANVRPMAWATTFEEGAMSRCRMLYCALVALAVIVGSQPVAAQDTLKVAAGQRAGIFKKHGLVLEILWTQGGGETQQAVISGSVDIGVAPGIMGVLSAFSKGAPVRIIGAETTGASYRQAFEQARSYLHHLSTDDQAKILGGTAARLFGFVA